MKESVDNSQEEEQDVLYGHLPKYMQEEHNKREKIKKAKMCHEYLHDLECLQTVRMGYCLYIHDPEVRKVYRELQKGFITEERTEQMLKVNCPDEDYLIQRKQLLRFSQPMS